MSRGVRLSSALAHAVPGVAVSFRTADGSLFVVGRHPAADVDPCEWRRHVLAGSRSPAVADLRPAGVAGTVRAVGGGSFVELADPAAAWLVTELCPRRTVAAMRQAPVPDGLEEAVVAKVRPDPALGVTVVGLRCDDRWPGRLVDEFRSRVVAELLAMELIEDLHQAHRAGEAS